MRKLNLAITHIWRFLLGLLLLTVAISLILVVTVISFLVYLCYLPFEKKNARELLIENGSFLKLVSIGIDILGNIVSRKVLNKVFLIEIKQFPFGVSGQKISSVLRWNYLLSNLSKYGLWMYNILEFLEDEHGRKSVDSEIELAETVIALNKELEETLKVT